MNIRIAAIVFALCTPLCGTAQQLAVSQVKERQVPPEEIVITGKRMLRQVWEAERQAYEVFNKFNKEKRFNISCGIDQPTGTRLETQVCKPEFELQATRDHALDYFENLRAELDPLRGEHNYYNPPTQFMPAEAVIASQLPEYHKAIKQVAEQHPEFVQAIIKYSKVKELYEGSTKTAANKD